MVPDQLTLERSRDLEQRQVKKHDIAIILLHWFNAFVWLVELISGIALIASDEFRVAPVWFIDLIREVFGARAHLLRFHIAIGLGWMAVFAVYGIFGFRTYLRGEVLRKEIALDPDDWAWLKVRILSLVGRSNEPLPPQGVYNAGQKLFALMVYAMLPVVMISGLVMTFHLVGATAVQWAIVIHFCAAGIVVSGLLIHVYMGAVFPEEKPAFFSMLTGTVNERYAYEHHYKWWKEMTMTDSSMVTAKPEATEPSPGWWQRVFRSPEYWPPYAAGTGLGLTLLASFVVMGTGLGASGGFTRYLVAALQAAVPGHAASHPYWSTYAGEGQSPLIDFLVFELIGVAIGGFVSGWLAHRAKFAVDKGTQITNRTRYVFALSGGIVTGIGARLARGCTSGLALSGGAILSAGAFVFMLAVFAAGFGGAWILRRYWL